MTSQPRLLCIDLQTGDGALAAPDARAVFGARQLLSIARRSGWTVAHTRMRQDAINDADMSARRNVALRPLTSERVFLRNRRSSADCPALIEQLEQWSRDTVYVAAFDPLALLALLIDRLDRGPNLVLVEDAISTRISVASRVAVDPVTSAIHTLAPRVTIPDLADARASRAERARHPT